MSGVAQCEALIASLADALDRCLLFAPDRPQGHFPFAADRVGMRTERLAQFPPAIEFRMQFEPGTKHVALADDAAPFVGVSQRRSQNRLRVAVGQLDSRRL